MGQATTDATRACLGRICRSEAFSGSKRLQGFLSYVVEEELAGRGADIRAKTIGMDVHGYSPEEIVERENVVRVDAGRVRRKLEEYYRQAPEHEPVQIALPVGTYRPKITAQTATPHVAAPKFARFAPLMAVLAMLGLAALAAAGWVFTSDRDAPQSAARNQLDQIFDISPARVEAANLAEIGRDLIFPALDPNRMTLALEVFDATIAKDQSYFGGYAGKAQAYAIMAVVAQDEAVAARSLAQAQRFSAQASQIQPEAAWALSARAWVQFVLGEVALAKELSGRALSLAPMDPHVIEFDSLIALYQGDFTRILEQAEARAGEEALGENFVFQNALGSAFFHTGDYAQSIRTIEGAIAAGAPFGPVSISYLMAAHHMAGDDVKAAELARLLARTWPSADVLQIKDRLFVHRSSFDQLADAIHAVSDPPQ
jgi:tetratricopeptide (TPR) repeat protein